MSKFTEMLGRAGRQEAEPLGFGRTAKKPDRMPDILLVGRIHPGDLPRLDAGKSSIEVFLLETDSLSQKLLNSASKSLDGTVWGLRMRALKGADVEGLKRAGCDFVVFEAAETEAAVLNDEDMGRRLDSMIRQITRAIEDAREAAPVGTFFQVFSSAF